MILGTKVCLSGSLNSPTGKCSHGGINDTSSQIPAQGGINKERFNPQYSPHYKLHAKAAEYAVKATENFISNNETGLVSVIPYKVFQKIFALFHKEQFSKSSLTFCIDTTGSMKDEINAVISKSIDIVSSSQGSANEPTDYVLTTFNDPANVTHYVTTDGYLMITRLRQLGAYGGGDCPEYAMSGLSAAVNYSLPGSTIYFFSDADAKDANLGPTVINKANEKKIKIEFLLTGSCRRRRRRTGKY
ncbi:hypothetical protein FSP39_001940 [Pinctada imbricata]|uniref:VWFA domain-containing protein n=1 Tax=Pinctada imbricata TaxID=66713 RepID=A0AA88XET1_PINIB|nr:hypothetical protein FSP39_001940 [Pinctada imbricata]